MFDVFLLLERNLGFLLLGRRLELWSNRFEYWMDVGIEGWRGTGGKEGGKEGTHQIRT